MPIASKFFDFIVVGFFPSIKMNERFSPSYLTLFSEISANWTPKFDGDVRPRAGLVFVEPKVYSEFLKEEAQIRNQTAMMARSRSTNINTLEDDTTVLETVES